MLNPLRSERCVREFLTLDRGEATEWSLRAAGAKDTCDDMLGR